ncbi:hypothetical protein [Lewinella sp. W8]|uniref:hypothetical protein n=1 Tax=Lewinella sp. W8 TaxID=2528208 RepID=UPI0010685D87|nr:hypothetical protein [Lewinella sp. W8]MTB53656.1 hypothetical protein [Lewinella sp. W8]
MEGPGERQANSLSKWLDNLQQESWQLELLISGFTVFLLIAGLEPYHALEAEVDRLMDTSLAFDLLVLPYQTFRAAYYVLLAGLIIHVALRGLWIACVGLRSVSGDIDISALNFQSGFADHLAKKIGSFDRYIERLENLCSVLFAYVFLLVFCLISMLLYVIFVAVLRVFLQFILGTPLTNQSPFANPVVAFFLGLGILYFIDFITLGALKRWRWTAKIYYPFYRLVSFITLANVYRPIYYNLVDNPFGRKMAYLAIPLLLLVLTAMSFQYVGESYVAYNPDEEPGYWYRSEVYEDQVDEVNLERPSVPTQFVDNGLLPVFLPYLPAFHDPNIQKVCPELEPGKYSGPKLRGAFRLGEIVNFDSDAGQLLGCMQQLWRIRINDSTYTEVPLRFYYHPERKQYGLRGIIPVYHLPPGEHQLMVDRYRLSQDRMQWFPGREIYFSIIP